MKTAVSLLLVLSLLFLPGLGVFSASNDWHHAEAGQDSEDCKELFEEESILSARMDCADPQHRSFLCFSEQSLYENPFLLTGKRPPKISA